MSISRVNISKTICVLHNGVITWNYLPDALKVNVCFSVYKYKIRNFHQQKYWFWAPLWLHFLFDMNLLFFKWNNCLGFKYWTVKFAIVSFVVLIRIAIVIGFVPVSRTVIIIRLFSVNRIVIKVRIAWLLYLIRLGLCWC